MSINKFNYSFNSKILNNGDNKYFLAILEIVFRKMSYPFSDSDSVSIEDIKNLITSDMSLKILFGHMV